MNMFAAQMDERTKKVLLVLCALFIIALLIFGFIYYIISKYMQKESKKMDTYMYDLLKMKIVKNTKQFKRALHYHEQRSLFNNSKWAFRAIIILTVISIVIAMVIFDGDINGLFTEVFKLFPIIKWPTVGEINETLKDIEGAVLITGPSWLPASIFPAFISKNPDFSSALLYVSTIYYVCMLACVIVIFKAVLGYMARLHRGYKMSIQVFTKDLDKIDLFNVDQYAQQVNSPVPNQENYTNQS